MINTQIPIYGIMLILALISNIIVVLLIYNKNKFKIYEIIGALIYENIGIILGAKVLTFFVNYSKFENFDILKLGLSSYGAAIGALVCLIVFSIQFRKNIKELLCIFAPSIPLMYAIGKIGCFFAGCCYGIEYNGLGCINYKYSLRAPSDINLFPVQIVETIIFTAIFVYIIVKVSKKKFDLKNLGITFVLCSCSKFILDFFRNSGTNSVFSTNKIISIIFFIIGIFVIWYNSKFSKEDMSLKCENCNKVLQVNMKYCPYCSYEIKK